MKPSTLLRFALPVTLSLALAACASTPDAPVHLNIEQPASAQNETQTDAAANLAALVEQVDIPYEVFTLENGLTTIVHTDRKSPIVGLTVYYRVGSKHEPRGRTGFAHLFEHLMFGGSENVENFDIPLEAAGSTSTNGSTYFDRTNYVEAVPTGALDLALFMESDRMGYLLGAVTQEKLDNQRMVVQNEKRQGDNQPYGLLDYLTLEGLLPVGHPYRHSTIGSLADLDAASMQDVRDWFTANYGPNNVVLVLAGDIDMATARPKVERWFGEIPRGADIVEVEAAPVTLPAPINRTTTDQVPLTAIYRSWVGPGLEHSDAVPLQIGLHILGGLASSRLDNSMVRGEELAVSVSSYVEQFEQLSQIQATINVKDGIERDVAEAALDAQIALMLENGPTQEELERAQTQILSSAIGGLERVGGFGGKGMILAEGLLYADDPGFYRKDLERMVALTPQDVQAAMQRWLSRPAFTLTIEPGDRSLNGDTMGGWGDEAINPPPAPDERAPFEVTRTGDPRQAPPIAPVGELTFPQVEQAQLSNGIPVILARRTSIPQISMAMVLDGGSIVDPAGKSGVHESMIDLLSEGTTSLTSEEIAIIQEDLGSSVSAGAGVETDTFYLSTLSTNLRPSLALMADIALNPAFREEDVARVKQQRLAEIAQELSSPGSIAARAFMPIIYGEDHPYALASTSGNAEVIERLSRQQLFQEHQKWFRPDLASITVVGDVTMEELLSALEESFGAWELPANSAPRVNIAIATPPPATRLIVVNRPNSPSSFLMLGRTTPLTGNVQNIETISLANEIMGNGFLSRLNSDLRETKGWTYGVRSSLPYASGQRNFRVQTQVQADRTADSIRAIIEQLEAFPATNPANEVEVQRVTDGNIRGLPNRYETNAQVLGALVANQRVGRDIRYQTQLPALYRAIDGEAIDEAAGEYLQPDNFTIVVVGDRAIIDEQIATLDMEVTYLDADEL